MKDREFRRYARLPEYALSEFRKLRELINGEGITLTELSRRTGVSAGSLTGYLRYNREPAPKQYNLLAEYYGWEKVPENE